MDVWNVICASYRLVMSLVSTSTRFIRASAASCRLTTTVIVSAAGTLSFKVTFAIPISSRLGVSITLPWEVFWTTMVLLYSCISELHIWDTFINQLSS